MTCATPRSRISKPCSASTACTLTRARCGASSIRSTSSSSATGKLFTASALPAARTASARPKGMGGYELTCHLTGEYPRGGLAGVFNRPVSAWAAGDTGKTTRNILQRKLLGPVGRWAPGSFPASSSSASHAKRRRRRDRARLRRARADRRPLAARASSPTTRSARASRAPSRTSSSGRGAADPRVVMAGWNDVPHISEAEKKDLLKSSRPTSATRAPRASRSSAAARSTRSRRPRSRSSPSRSRRTGRAPTPGRGLEAHRGAVGRLRPRGRDLVPVRRALPRPRRAVGARRGDPRARRVDPGLHRPGGARPLAGRRQEAHRQLPRPRARAVPRRSRGRGRHLRRLPAPLHRHAQGLHAAAVLARRVPHLPARRARPHRRRRRTT
jgi:hypothetical protein